MRGRRDKAMSCRRLEACAPRASWALRSDLLPAFVEARMNPVSRCPAMNSSSRTISRKKGSVVLIPPTRIHRARAEFDRWPRRACFHTASFESSGRIDRDFVAGGDALSSRIPGPLGARRNVISPATGKICFPIFGVDATFDRSPTQRTSSCRKDKTAPPRR